MSLSAITILCRRLKNRTFSSTELRDYDFSERKDDGTTIQRTLEASGSHCYLRVFHVLPSLGPVNCRQTRRIQNLLTIQYDTLPCGAQDLAAEQDAQRLSSHSGGSLL